MTYILDGWLAVVVYEWCYNSKGVVVDSIKSAGLSSARLSEDFLAQP